MLPFLPFLFALIIAERGSTLSTPAASWEETLAWIAGGTVVWAIVATMMNRHIARKRSARLLIWWDIAAQAYGLGWLAWLCLDLGWALHVPGVMLALIPYLLVLMIHWATFSVGVRGVTRQPWTRLSMLIHQIRFTSLPLILLFGTIVDVSDYASGLWFGRVPMQMEILGFAALGLGALIFAPLLMSYLWGAQPLPEGDLKKQLEDASTRMGFPAMRIRRWPVPHGRFYNAVVIGFIPHTRSILFSDGLLQDLTSDELIAVLGHELGHAQHRHLGLYLLFLGGVLSIGTLCSDLLHQGLLPVPAWLMTQSWGETALALFGALIAWRIGFGWLSRGCERQADLAGAALVGSPQIMAQALKSVARLSGEPENAPNWRHHSIAQRAAYMQHIAEHPAQAEHHHHTMRFSLIILLTVMLVSLALNVWLGPAAQAALAKDPAGALTSWTEREPDLAAAITTADNGDPADLAKWYQRANGPNRQTFAMLTLALSSAGPNGPDDAELYRLRYRLEAISGIDSGNAEINLEIDNALAYGLVAGVEIPTERDLATARRLLPNLEHALAVDPNHALYDTVGCIRFRLGDWTQSADAFQNALSAAETANKDEAFSSYDLVSTLYTKRLAIASHNRDCKPSERQPLYLELGPRAATTESPSDAGNTEKTVPATQDQAVDMLDAIPVEKMPAAPIDSASTAKASATTAHPSVDDPEAQPRVRRVSKGVAPVTVAAPSEDPATAPVQEKAVQP